MRPRARAALSNLKQRSPRARRQDVPGPRVERLLQLALVLLRDGSIEFASYNRRFARSKRQFDRDLKHLRTAGTPAGLLISGQRGGRVVLQEVPGKLKQFGETARERRREVAATLSRIARALGKPVERELTGLLDDASAQHESFMQLRTPRPTDEARVAEVFEYFRDAAASYARVEFRYVDGLGRETTRRVEPYHAVLRDGRYYLVAYDVAPNKGWRYFALDSIAGPYRREGTFSPRSVPPRYHRELAVGWIQRSAPTAVTFRVRPPAAAAVLAKRWQDDQRVRRLSGGVAEITLSFADVQEAVRWALSFGAEATIVAPAEAVAVARETAARILETYDDSLATRLA